MAVIGNARLPALDSGRQNRRNHEPGELRRRGTHVEVVVVVLFMLFAGVVAYIVRPRNRRRSRRPVALSAATDSPDPPFVERRRGGDRSRLARLKAFFSRRRRRP